MFKVQKKGDSTQKCIVKHKKYIINIVEGSVSTITEEIDLNYLLNKLISFYSFLTLLHRQIQDCCNFQDGALCDNTKRLPAVNYYHKALHLGCYSSPRSASVTYFREVSTYFSEKLLQEAVVWRCFVKQLFSKISQNLQENTCARVFFSKAVARLRLQPY